LFVNFTARRWEKSRYNRGHRGRRGGSGGDGRGGRKKFHKYIINFS